MTPHILLEVAVASAADARTAAAAGADRLEVSCALELDGLTPTLGTLAAVRAVGLPLVVLLRPRPGGFVYTAEERAVMRADLDAIPDPVALGALTAEGEIDTVALRQFPTERVVFHRAFDLVRDVSRALEVLIDLGVRRVMAHAVDIDRVARLIAAARGRIEVLPAGGVRPETAVELVRRTGCTQLHGSFRRPTPRVGPFAGQWETCGDAVRRTRAALDERTARPA